MSYGDVTTQIVREDPAVEAYRLGLLKDVQQFIGNQMQNPNALPPAYQVAGLSGLEQQAALLGASGIGSYQPYMQQGAGYLGQAGAATGQGLSTLNQAASQGAYGTQLGQSYAQAAANRLGNYAVQGVGQAIDPAMARMQSLGYGLQNQGAQTAAQLQALAGGLPGQMSGTYQGLNQATFAAQQAAAAGGRDIQEAGYMSAGIGTGGMNRLSALQGQVSPQVQAAQAQLGAGAQFGMGAAQQGIASLAGTGDQFDPRGISAYYNPFEQQAVNQALSDLQRQGDLQQQNIAAQAVRSGAFGGSREAIARQELQRNVMEQQGRTAAQMRQAGYSQAAQQAQTAYEQAQARRQQAAQLTGQLGQAGASALMQAGQAGGQLGLQGVQSQADIVNRASQLGLAGQQALMQSGQMAGQLGLSAAQQQAANAAQMGQLGLSTAQAQAGMYGQAGQAGQAGMQAALQAAQQQGALGLQGVQQQGALTQQAGQFGLQAGQLGQSYGNLLSQLGAQQGALGSQYGTLGLQYAGLGELGQQLNARDIATLSQLGATERGLQQNILDAQRQSTLAAQAFPYQQYAFLSDIYKGTPSAQQTILQQATAQPSAFQQAAGLGIAGLSAAAGAQQAGII